jgi:hypothetical protein
MNKQLQEYITASMPDIESAYKNATEQKQYEHAAELRAVVKGNPWPTTGLGRLYRLVCEYYHLTNRNNESIRNTRS